MIFSKVKDFLYLFFSKLKSLKSSLGFYGDLIVFVCVWLFVQEVVPYGSVLTSFVTVVFGLMFVFSVLYIVWARVR